MRHVHSSLVFSRTEIEDLLRAWAATSLAFAIFFIGGLPAVLRSSFSSLGNILVVAAFTGGVGFIVHELCHKIVAHHFRIHGEFRSHNTMLLVSIVCALLGFLLAAPGAVYLSGNVSRKESGIISVAGPLSNVVLALFFLPLALGGGLLGTIGLLINAFLAFFNMIPFLNFDGQKVFAWSKLVYFVVLVFSLVLVAFSYTIM